MGKFCYYGTFCDILGELMVLANSRNGRLEILAARLTVRALVWHVWHERKCRTFNNTTRTNHLICMTIFPHIRSRIFFFLSNNDLYKLKGPFSALWDLPSPDKPLTRFDATTVISNPFVPTSCTLLIRTLTHNNGIMLVAHYQGSSMNSHGCFITPSTSSY